MQEFVYSCSKKQKQSEGFIKHLCKFCSYQSYYSGKRIRLVKIECYTLKSYKFLSLLVKLSFNFLKFKIRHFCRLNAGWSKKSNFE